MQHFHSQLQNTEHQIEGRSPKVAKWKNFLLYNPNNPVNSQESTATSSAECMNNKQSQKPVQPDITVAQ